MRVPLRTLLMSAWLVSSAGLSRQRPSSGGFQEDRPDRGRTFTNSQVLAFNVSNFMVVLFLKALLVALGFATGFSGLGLYAGGYGRADDHGPPLSPVADQGRMTWLTTYLAALNTGDDACLRRLACEDPGTARMYASGKEMLLYVLRRAPVLLPYNSAYDRMVESVRTAARIGNRHQHLCRRKYPCPVSRR
ncbi:uncharacterized protein ISCGN_029137 [Ixodes scapularis]